MRILWSRKQATAKVKENVVVKRNFQETLCITDDVLSISDVPSERVLETGISPLRHAEGLLHGEPTPPEQCVEVQLFLPHLRIPAVGSHYLVIVGIAVVR